MYLCLELALPADARLLATTRRSLAGYLADMGADADEQADVVLALDEACVNVIRHAFPPGSEGSFRVRVELDGATVILEVEDSGRGFSPAEVDLRESRLHDVSGRGLQIIRALMTSVRLQSPTESGGTRLCMERVLRDPRPEKPPFEAMSRATARAQ
ncbi:MAG TPA: ATP-binding protein [Acidimicrobiales bacterium]|nr:ATP-binding protein [Acidimicrobiales bacterium]